MTRQAGFSLSDLLISLLLSSFLMTILFQCYLTAKEQYLDAEKRLVTGFELQWVSDMLADSVRRAGFTPCLGIESLQVYDSRTGLRQVVGLRIDNNAGGLIEVRRMSEHFSPILSLQNSSQIVIPTRQESNKKRAVLIADCAHAEIHQVLNSKPFAQATLVTLSKPLLFTYAKPVYFGEWLEETWRIKTNAHGVKALYYQAEQSEMLSLAIVSLQASEQRIRGRRLLDIVFGLEKENTEKLVVAVRGA